VDFPDSRRPVSVPAGYRLGEAPVASRSAPIARPHPLIGMQGADHRRRSIRTRRQAFIENADGSFPTPRTRVLIPVTRSTSEGRSRKACETSRLQLESIVKASIARPSRFGSAELSTAMVKPLGRSPRAILVPRPRTPALDQLPGDNWRRRSKALSQGSLAGQIDSRPTPPVTPRHRAGQHGTPAHCATRTVV
jgi:hypothetical protein